VGPDAIDAVPVKVRIVFPGPASPLSPVAANVATHERNARQGPCRVEWLRYNRGMDLGLKGKVAIVTGSSRGLGLASAKSLAAEGCRVCVCARGEAGLRDAPPVMRRPFCPSPPM
jgi:hypothetical protein